MTKTEKQLHMRILELELKVKALEALLEEYQDSEADMAGLGMARAALEQGWRDR